MCVLCAYVCLCIMPVLCVYVLCMYLLHNSLLITVAGNLKKKAFIVPIIKAHDEINTP